MHLRSTTPPCIVCPLSRQLFVGQSSARADLLRLCFAAVAEEGASERARQFYIDVFRRIVQAPDALGTHIESTQEWCGFMLSFELDLRLRSLGR